MYTPREIATILDKTDRTILNYIASGLIVATREGNAYKISCDSLNDYLKNINNRDTKKTLTKKRKVLSKDEIDSIEDLFLKAKSAPNIEAFIKSFENKAFIIPFLEVFNRYKRNEAIKIDRYSNGMPCTELAHKYNLSLGMIEKIIYKDKKMEENVTSNKQYV